MPIDFTNERVKRICGKNDIAELRLFGSRARGQEREGSDVDLLVWFSKPKSLLSMVAIERELSEALESPVDLLTEQAVSPHLRDRIMRESRVVYHA